MCFNYLSSKDFRRRIQAMKGELRTPKSGTKWPFFDAFRAFVHSCTIAVLRADGQPAAVLILLFMHA